NGKGFDTTSIGESNGLANMKHRVVKISGHFQLDSDRGIGTTITYRTKGLVGESVEMVNENHA
ncbi:MAG: hypothetical protein K2Q22_14670, partial [Cytophagales bacterium]|nr:hypothetical protein [Cytophagales bacterium]